MLYEREGDGAISCERHTRFTPMSDAEEAAWRQRIAEELGYDATPCEDCAQVLGVEATILEYGDQVGMTWVGPTWDPEPL